MTIAAAVSDQIGAVFLAYGVLAAIIPARQAARLDVVQALHYE